MSRARLEEMLAQSEESERDAAELRAALTPLADLATVLPPPVEELRALFEAPQESRPDAQRTRSGPRGTVAGAVVLALAGVGATGLSAAANTLPRPWQHQMAHFSHRYLPFDLPEPAARHHPATPDGSGTPGGDAGRTVAEQPPDGRKLTGPAAPTHGTGWDRASRTLDGPGAADRERAEQPRSEQPPDGQAAPADPAHPASTWTVPTATVTPKHDHSAGPSDASAGPGNGDGHAQGHAQGHGHGHGQDQRGSEETSAETPGERPGESPGESPGGAEEPGGAAGQLGTGPGRGLGPHPGPGGKPGPAAQPLLGPAHPDPAGVGRGVGHGAGDGQSAG